MSTVEGREISHCLVAVRRRRGDGRGPEWIPTFGVRSDINFSGRIISVELDSGGRRPVDDKEPFFVTR